MSEVETTQVRKIMRETGADFQAALQLIATLGSVDAVLRRFQSGTTPEIREIEIEYWHGEDATVMADVIEPLGIHAGPEKKMWSIAYIPLGKRMAKAKTYVKAMKAMRFFLARCNWKSGEELEAAVLKAAELGMIER